MPKPKVPTFSKMLFRVFVFAAVAATAVTAAPGIISGNDNSMVLGSGTNAREYKYEEPGLLGKKFEECLFFS